MIRTCLALALAAGSADARAMTCTASAYWQPQPTASGERFQPHGLTAAHRTAPMGSRWKVTNVHNGRSVVVRINDRGPYIAGRCIDLALGAANVIGIGKGLGRVTIERVGDG